MKKFDFSFGGGREVLSREQMKAVTGGLYQGGSTCSFMIDVTQGDNAGSRGGVEVGCSGGPASCRAFVESHMAYYESQYGGTYGGGLSCASC